jgi:hypothetical protein
MKNSEMSLSKAYDLLIAYFEAQREENRIFDIDAAQDFLAKGEKLSPEKTETKGTGDALRDIARAVPFMNEEKIGISTALSRIPVNLRQLKELNMKDGIFLTHGHATMKNGSAIRKLKIEPGSTMLGARPPMPSVGRELLERGNGFETALKELELSLEGNILDARQDSYARLSGIVSAFEEILTSVKADDFKKKLSYFYAEKNALPAPRSNTFH